MTSRHSVIRSTFFGLVGASLLAASAASFANHASGGPLTALERQQVTSGMTADQVRQTAGNPLYVRKYARSADTTWVYATNETASNAEVQIDFGPDGRVKGNTLAWRNGRSGKPI